MSIRKGNFWGNERGLSACTSIRLLISWYEWKCFTSYVSVQGLIGRLLFQAVAQKGNRGAIPGKLNRRDIVLLSLCHSVVVFTYAWATLPILNEIPKGKDWEYSFSAQVPVQISPGSPILLHSLNTKDEALSPVTDTWQPFLWAEPAEWPGQEDLLMMHRDWFPLSFSLSGAHSYCLKFLNTADSWFGVPFPPACLLAHDGSGFLASSSVVKNISDL